MTPLRLEQRALLEFVGTAMLLTAIVGSGIMAANLAQGNIALALLCNTLATAATLAAVIAAMGALSGAHLNPIITLAAALVRPRPWTEVIAYVAAQITGGILGVAFANAMFVKPIFFASTHIRAGGPQLLGEAVATFGLVLLVLACIRSQSRAVPWVVASYIAGAYWFTSSTSFANPAVTIARSLSDTFAGIRPADVPGFIVAQVVGAAVALCVGRLALEGRPVKAAAGAIDERF